MFLALRDIRFAKGRFALMGTVVALITLLLVMLSGLTAGLGNQSISAIANLAPAANAIAFGAPAGNEPKASYTESQISAAQLDAWQQADGVAHAEPFGIAQTRLAAGASTNVAVFGVEPGGRLAPAEVAEGSAVLSRTAAEDLGTAVGRSVELSGRTFTVAAIAEDQWYSHTPVVWTTLRDWQRVAHINDGGASSGPIGTAIAVELSDGKADGAAAAAANEAAGTVTTSVTGSFQALGSYKSENGSLLMMQGFLYGISALVIVAFLTVWTIQRTRDIAVLKAMGATDRYLLRDALTQAGLVLAAGAIAGGAAGVFGGSLAAQAAPFLLTAGTTLVPIAGIVLLGLAGAALAVRRVTKVDPLTALGGN
ncbi:ABC transporter permease [Arthrobacter crystallopoietes BAB-32]|uniref:ABC transporter permease n=1 Tax=Arthrobacter crystallopoietes BAB-32 TaxID=1246476 RepID=N1UXL6_9MICC|nr:ABC transporter permease [Arthrobacter crystallopoietes]EMY33775.1 ABC transporter permease [Arthrobacter crystallopoietes BAB-32]